MAMLPMNPQKGIKANQLPLKEKALFFTKEKELPNIFSHKAPEKATSELSMNWGYCGDPYSAVPLPKGTLKGAIMITPEIATQFAGAEISAIQVGNPTNQQYNNPFKNKELTVWISESLDGEPICSGTGKFGAEGFEYTSVDLEEIYTLKADTPIYIGYTFEVTSSNGVYSLIIDGYYPVNEHTAYVYTSGNIDDEGYIVEEEDASWKNFSNEFGNICLTATLSGDMLPCNQVILPDYLIPYVVKPNSEFDFVFNTYNDGANSISDIDLTLDIEGEEPQVKRVELYYGPLAYHQASLDTTSFVCKTFGKNVPYNLYVSAINGNPVENVFSIKGSFMCLEKGFQRNVVIEEATGTWCGYCVIGYAGMEYMKEHYSDKGFIGIALHEGDRMRVLDPGGAYESFDEYISGYPSAFMDRNWNNSIYPAPEELEYEFLNMVDLPAYAQINANYIIDENNSKNVTLTTSSMFALDEENANYGIAYAVVEDNVGPYDQTNYLSGSGEDAYGFENMPSPVSLIYNDVARNCSHPLPFEGSIPTSINANTSYDFSTDINLKGVTDLNNYRIIAMVIDGETGYILNACQATEGEAGVNEIFDNASALRVIGGKGQVVVNGNIASIYSADGRNIATNVEGSVSLPAGLYIVKSNNKTVKVIVR